MNILMIASKIVANPLAVTTVCSLLSGFLYGRIEVANKIENYLEEYGNEEN